MNSFEGGVTGSPRDAPEKKWFLGGRIEIPCPYESYGGTDQKEYLRKKKLKGLNIFFNTL